MDGSRYKDFELSAGFLDIYSRKFSRQVIVVLKQDTLLAVDLDAQKVHGHSVQFIYDQGDLKSVSPTSIGFEAHTSFS